MTEQHDSISYLLEHSEIETRRLQEQARLMEEETRAVLSRVGINEGAKCLDVGCGAGDVMKLMAEYTGVTGSVTGIDLNDKIGLAAVNRLNATGLSKFHFIHADVRTTSSVPENMFDLTFARLLLLHVTDPVAVITRMWQWTSPGGHLVVMDYDFLTQGTYPRLAVVEEYNRVILELLERTGRDPRIGHKLPAQVTAACGGELVSTYVNAILLPMTQIADLLSAGYKGLLPAALQLGITTEAKAVQFFADMNAARASNSHFLSPLLVSAWKQKL